MSSTADLPADASGAVRPVAVEFHGGQPRLVITDIAVLEELSAIIQRANRQRAYRGVLPLQSAGPFLQGSRRAIALMRLVAQIQPDQAAPTLPGPEWITAKEAARLAAVTEQAITKRARQGSITATKVAGSWWVKAEEVPHELA